MKMKLTSKILRAALIALAALGATTAQANGSMTSSPFGLALGQTARLSYLNASQTETILVAGRFVDGSGALLQQFNGAVAPGQTISFDLNRDSLTRDANRLEVHVVIDSLRPRTKQALPSLEVFNNADGTTSVRVVSGEVFVKLPPAGLP